MHSLQNRKTNAYLIFHYKLLNNIIDFPFSLQSINFYCPSYSSYRSNSLFYLDKTTPEAKKIATFQILNNYNSKISTLDILSMTLGKFKSSLAI